VRCAGITVIARAYLSRSNLVWNTGDCFGWKSATLAITVKKYV
jgi:hypothetical protein